MNNLPDELRELMEIGKAWLKLTVVWQVLLLVGYGFTAWLIFRLVWELHTLFEI